jgi:hypothetical protein
MKKNIIHVIYPDEVAFSFVVTNDLSVEDNLERTFAEWNHGSGMESDLFVGSKKRSLSVNDIVCVNGKCYQCQSFGWKEVTAEYVIELENDVANHPRRIEGAWFALNSVMYERGPRWREATLDGIDVF